MSIKSLYAQVRKRYRKGISRQDGSSFFAIFTCKYNHNMEKFTLEDLPYLPNARVVSKLEMRASDNRRHYYSLKKLTLDGAPIHGIMENKDHMPTLRISRDGRGIYIILYPQMARFIVRYMLTGAVKDYPKPLNDGEIPENRYTEDDYIIRHVKRETERNSYTCVEEERDGVKGIHFKAYYPYGSIDYGFLPYTKEQLSEILEHTEPFIMSTHPCDIPELSNAELPTEQVSVKEGRRMSDIFPDGIPTNTIIDKTVCGIGATYLEIHTDRDSIIVEPNVPVIMGKMQHHGQIIGVYGEKTTHKDIADKVKSSQGRIKIMTTPDSYMKVTAALKSLGINYRNRFFLLFDECEKLVSEIDYRPNLFLPVDDFFLFKNKAMVSATPIVVNDPRFAEQNFKIIKVRPEYDHRQVIELKPTNNVNAMLRKTLERIGEEPMKCIFFNSVKGIKEIIDTFRISDQSNIYCSTEAYRELRKSGYNVHDSITDKLNRYNFFTSRFYSAVDIVIDEKPVVIMMTQVYKTIGDKIPYSLIDPETEAIQIAGRFRNGTDRIIHITNTATSLSYESREQLRERLQEEHQGYLKLDKLCKEAKTAGEKDITEQAISRTDYVGQGFVDGNGNINYFRHNNAYLDERLKMLYTHPARLYRAYEKSGAFTVYSEAEFAVYTDEERRKLKDTNTGKAERIGLLFNIISKAEKSRGNVDWLYYKQLMDELRNDYALYMEAFGTIGYAKVKELNFVDSDIKTAVNDFKYRSDTTRPEVKDAVYKAFSENTMYKTSDIKAKLKGIYDSAGLKLHRKPQGQDICQYFKATEKRNGKARGWQLGKKLEK